jgi:mannose-1-phosphate guanylyltransferase
VATEYTEEQIAEVQAIIAERQKQAAEAAAKLAAEQKAKEDADLKPLRTWLASEHVVQVMDEFNAFIEPMRDIVRVSPYAYNFLTALSSAAGPLPVEAPVEPEAPEEAEGETDEPAE